MDANGSKTMSNSENNQDFSANSSRKMSFSEAYALVMERAEDMFDQMITERLRQIETAKARKAEQEQQPAPPDSTPAQP